MRTHYRVTKFNIKIRFDLSEDINLLVKKGVTESHLLLDVLRTDIKVKFQKRSRDAYTKITNFNTAHRSRSRSTTKTGT